MDSWNTNHRVSRVQSDVGLSRRQRKKRVIDRVYPRLARMSNAGSVPESTSLWSCTWHLQTINHAKSHRTPSKTLLYWQLMATYSADSCLKNYCDDVFNKVHSVTTAVVAVSTARHHFVSWKDYPVGPLRRGFEMGLHDGAH